MSSSIPQLKITAKNFASEQHIKTKRLNMKKGAWIAANLEE